MKKLLLFSIVLGCVSGIKLHNIEYDVFVNATKLFETQEELNIANEDLRNASAEFISLFRPNNRVAVSKYIELLNTYSAQAFGTFLRNGQEIDVEDIALAINIMLTTIEKDIDDPWVNMLSNLMKRTVHLDYTHVDKLVEVYGIMLLKVTMQNKQFPLPCNLNGNLREFHELMAGLYYVAYSAFESVPNPEFDQYIDKRNYKYTNTYDWSIFNDCREEDNSFGRKVKQAIYDA
ncbi:unnamed protein product [Bursaphelenchus okinawaensis]|uniref:Uncharacterized protein n=1 Tax=Bursaphelenchus okinawaensis TaxID=465554 RepID=A0A811KFI7_9BILA|nr:unnamed protein product [Bursaphelenchus okinawaensis]CAG9102114.1 unnamed protein product [Bursaphelenchus okinawaensis]